MSGHTRRNALVVSAALELGGGDGDGGAAGAGNAVIADGATRDSVTAVAPPGGRNGGRDNPADGREGDDGGIGKGALSEGEGGEGAGKGNGEGKAGDEGG